MNMLVDFKGKADKAGYTLIVLGQYRDKEGNEYADCLGWQTAVFLSRNSFNSTIIVDFDSAGKITDFNIIGVQDQATAMLRSILLMQLEA